MGEEGKSHSLEKKGFLPPAPEMPESYTTWQSGYRSVCSPSRLEAKEGISTNISLKAVNDRAEQLRKSQTSWLNSPDFLDLDKRLREDLSHADEIRVLVCSPERQVARLPWQLWDLIENYQLAEVAFGFAECEAPQPSSPANFKNKVRILAILGHSEGIDVNKDRQFLEALPDAEVTFLVEPKREEISDRLWEQPWDILFFAGHSQTEQETDTGRIDINPHESLTLQELKKGLEKSIARGLHIAIFNSCDGLGLAWALEKEKLNLPQIVVMREPVPDLVAQRFLKYFLQEFSGYYFNEDTGKIGPTPEGAKPFYVAVRQARERLQTLEKDYPCTRWLPAIFQNRAVVPLTWAELGHRGESVPKSLQGQFLKSMSQELFHSPKKRSCFELRFAPENRDAKHGEIAAMAGVSESTVAEAIRGVRDEFEAEIKADGFGDDVDWQVVSNWLWEKKFSDWLWQQLAAMAAEAGERLRLEEVDEKTGLPPLRDRDFSLPELPSTEIEVRKNVPYRLRIEPPQSGHLLLLNKGTSGTIYCCCPWLGYATSDRVSAGRPAYIPQEGSASR
jgi:hypothetical protein